MGEINGEAPHALDDLHDINVFTSGGGGSDDGEGNNVHSNVLNLVSAGICGVCTEGTAVSLASRARLPADGAVTVVTSCARRVAKETAHLEARLANERSTSTSAIRSLSAGNANISLSRRAIW